MICCWNQRHAIHEGHDVRFTKRFFLVCEATMAKPIGLGRILEGEAPFKSDMKNSALWNREKIKNLGS